MSKEFVTLKEIKQQPLMWQDTQRRIEEKKDEIEAFFRQLKEENRPVRVLFTGAGTSHFVGEVIAPYLSRKGRKGMSYQCVGTTDLVSNPYDYFHKDELTVLVSFARSGNSPESVAAVNLAEEFVDDLYEIVITCNEEGSLAVGAKDHKNTLAIVLHPDTNDKGFAMTSSFSSMLLAALLLFSEETSSKVQLLCEMAEEALAFEKDIETLMKDWPKRVVYLGSGPLARLTREAQLKILELTAGEIATCYESSLGFRHGPKSFINGETLVLSFVSNNHYTRQYDEDMLREIEEDGLAKKVVAISVLPSVVEGCTFQKGEYLEDVFLALPYIVIAQLVSYYAAVAVDNDVDSPSKTGTVNRVVQGVVIYPWSEVDHE